VARLESLWAPDDYFTAIRSMSGLEDADFLGGSSCRLRKTAPPMASTTLVRRCSRSNNSRAPARGFAKPAQAAR
jgi:hypothetical protein